MANGIILYEGLSELDGATPIVAIATFASANTKTGAMAQTWIMLRDIAPSAGAYEPGEADGAICGAGADRCTFALNADGKRGCYVIVANAPRSVWAAYKRGAYPVWDGAADVIGGRLLRIGAYGDPAAVPLPVWAAMAAQASGRTGYTHQWRTARADAYKGFVMASCDSLADVVEAEARGWRGFYVAPADGTADPVPGAMIHCPASAERGKRLTCADCLACGGADSKRRSVWIRRHR
jgi:hypothetical protein